MATRKKTGIVAKVKNAVTGMFSTDAPKRKARAGTTAKKAVKKTAKKAAKVVKKAARKVTATVKKATSPTKRAAVKKVSAKRSAAKRSAPATSMDRKLIALSQPYEVRDWCKSLGCTEAELRAAVAAVGNSAEKVRAHLGAR